MKIQFLGYAESIQHCDSSNVSLVVSDSDVTILIDVSGAPVMELKKANVDPLSISLLLLTHSHVDHIYALPSLIHQLWLMGRKEALVVLSNSETISLARKLCDVFNLSEKKNMFPIEWKILEKGKYENPLGSLSLEVFPVKHGVPTIGCSVDSWKKRFVYLSDGTPTSTYPKCVYDADILVHEAGGLAEDEKVLNSKGHSSSKEAGETARKLRARKLFICHVEDDKDKIEYMIDEARKEFKNTHLPVLHQVYEIE